MNKQQAQLQATRDVLRGLIKSSPYTTKYVAQQVGEEYTTLIHRLKGQRSTYQQLDTALVVNILALIDVPISEFFTQVESRAEDLMRGQ